MTSETTTLRELAERMQALVADAALHDHPRAPRCETCVALAAALVRAITAVVPEAADPD